MVDDTDLIRDLSYALSFKALLPKRPSEREAGISARCIIDQLRLAGWRFLHDKPPLEPHSSPPRERG